MRLVVALISLGLAARTPSPDQCQDTSDVSLLQAAKFLAKEDLTAEICPEPCRRGLFIGVPSAASNRDRRMVVRNTWMKSANSTGIGIAFYVCGPHASISAESEEFGDIVIIPCEEGYGSGLLTKKVLGMMTHFVAHVDRKFTSFMKADDDAFVNVPLLLAKVSTYPAKHFYMGLMYEPCKPVRDPQNLFYEPAEIWPYDYPRSACGAGYVLDRGLVERMVHTPGTILYNEDKAVGTWVAAISEGVKVDYVDLAADVRKRSQIKDFNWFWFAGLKIPELPMMIYHRLSPTEMACMWQRVQSGGRGFHSCQTVQHSALQLARSARKRQEDERIKYHVTR